MSAANYAVAFGVESLQDFFEGVEVCTAVDQCIIAVDGDNVHGYVHFKRGVTRMNACHKLLLGRAQVRLLELRDVRLYLERMSTYNDLRVLKSLSDRYTKYIGYLYDAALVAGSSMRKN